MNDLVADSSQVPLFGRSTLPTLNAKEDGGFKTKVMNSPRLAISVRNGGADSPRVRVVSVPTGYLWEIETSLPGRDPKSV